MWTPCCGPQAPVPWLAWTVPLLQTSLSPLKGSPAYGPSCHGAAFQVQEGGEERGKSVASPSLNVYTRRLCFFVLKTGQLGRTMVQGYSTGWE